jgi:putative peptidoglycan lipid II flippase
MRRSLGFAVTVMNYIAIPAAVGLFVLADPITKLIFERGAFGSIESAKTAVALQCYCVGLWSVSIARVLAPGFYALGEPRIPTLAAIGSVLLNIVLSLALMGPVALGSDSLFGGWIASTTRAIGIVDLRHAGLALATALAATFNAALLAVLLWRRVGGFEGGVFGSFLRSTTAAAYMAIVLLALSANLDWQDGGMVGQALRLGGVIVSGGVAFAAASLAIGGPDVERVRRLIAERWARRGMRR